jgi:hypothetical protein
LFSFLYFSRLFCPCAGAAGQYPRSPPAPLNDALEAKMLYAERAMYEDFQATDRWSGETLHCRWTANIVAIATRHADAVDVRFDVSGRPVWIAMPCLAWVEQKKRTGHTITDVLAAQAAGRYLKKAVESGYDNGREMYTMSIEEVLEQVDAILHEAGHTRNLPSLVPLDDAQPQV